MIKIKELGTSENLIDRLDAIAIAQTDTRLRDELWQISGMLSDLERRLLIDDIEAAVAEEEEMSTELGNALLERMQTTISAFKNAGFQC